MSKPATSGETLFIFLVLLLVASKTCDIQETVEEIRHDFRKCQKEGESP
jgi:hypothetical protein